jgi:CTP synthase (UTP-ammonia lyase)
MQKKETILRRITWQEGPSSETTIDFEDYLKLIKSYGEKKSKTTRSSRKYLREIGLIDKNNRLLTQE